MRKNYLVVTGLFLYAVAAANAQKVSNYVSQPIDVAVMFNADRTQHSYGNDFWTYGGSGEVSAHLKYNLGLTVNVVGLTEQGKSSLNSISKVITTAGPRYTLPWHQKHSRVFVEGLFGGVHGFNSVFPNVNGARNTSNAFAMQLGGGYDFNVSSTWAIRVVDVHYVRTDLPNGFTDRQEDLVLGAGIVWRPFDRSVK